MYTAKIYTNQRSRNISTPLVLLTEVMCDGEPFRKDAHCHIQKSEILDYLPKQNDYGYEVITLTFEADTSIYLRYDQVTTKMVEGVTLKNIKVIDKAVEWKRKPLKPQNPAKNKARKKKFKPDSQIKRLNELFNQI